jgi:hypothetical protein
MYDLRIHGIWEIAHNEKGVLYVREIKETKESAKEEICIGNGYIEAKNLRGYLAKNLDLIEN